MKTHNIALLPGDGIGPEIIAEGRKVIDAVAQKEKFKVKWTPYPFGADHYLATKELLNEDALKEMGPSITPDMEKWYKSFMQQVRQVQKPQTPVA